MNCQKCEALGQPGALCAECAAALIATSSEKNCGCGHSKEAHNIKHPAGDAICTCGCVGFERAGAAGNALDDINTACGYAEWDYPGQVVRAVCELKARAERAEDTIRQAIKELEEDDCTCGGIDIGVGEMHEPTCGLPNVTALLMLLRGQIVRVKP